MCIPTCVITGRVAGDRLACGDCDPCIGGAAKVPDAVKRLVAEHDDFMDKYDDAASELDDIRAAQDYTQKERCVTKECAICDGTGSVCGACSASIMDCDCGPDQEPMICDACAGSGIRRQERRTRPCSTPS